MACDVEWARNPGAPLRFAPGWYERRRWRQAKAAVLPRPKENFVSRTVKPAAAVRTG
jgi:hypothetical protein